MVYKFDGVPWGLKTVWFFSELADHVSLVMQIVNKKKFDAAILPFFPR